MIMLRDYQGDILHAVRKEAAEGVKLQIVCLPTGSALAMAALPSSHRPVVVRLRGTCNRRRRL